MGNDDNGGWLKKVLMWDWHTVCLDGYRGWEIERDGCPAFVRLAHVRGSGEVESHVLCKDWDDVAKGRFYQRDWTDDGIPFVRKGDTYWSGWWFETLAERDRFLEWRKGRHPACTEDVQT